jgi:hypothetical protein
MQFVQTLSLRIEQATLVWSVDCSLVMVRICKDKVREWQCVQRLRHDDSVCKG